MAVRKNKQAKSDIKARTPQTEGWVKRDSETGRFRSAKAEEPLANTAVSKAPTVEQRPIWEEILDLANAIPEPERAKLPTDGARNVDHYLYGHKKVDE